MSYRRPLPSAVLFALIALGALSAATDQAPVLSLPAAVDSYNGQVKETGQVVIVSPEIKVIDGTGPVCSYVLKDHGSTEWDAKDAANLPFTVDVVDRRSGLAAIRLKNNAYLDCSNPIYHLDIAAVHCESKKISKSALLNIQVKDINNHIPKFASDWQTVFVDEGRLYEQILKLNATDADCGHPYGEICRYEITTSGTPFTISNSGVLKNSQPLNYSAVHNYILSVVAYDCGLRRSEPMLLTVRVNPICVEGLKNVKPKLYYAPLSGSVSIAPEADLQLCNGQCQPDEVWANVKLNPAKAARGCDRDSYSLDKLKKLCGAHPRTVELLPSRDRIKLVGENNILTNEAAIPSDEVYVFDGVTNSIVVPYDVIKPTGIPEVFSLAFWMRRGRSDKPRNLTKEHIFCVSDDRRANRHHFSVYVKNCKLEMLYRREHVAHQKSDFQPAEWRWHVPEVCDDRWHYYAFIMKNLKVQLYVDGQSYALKEEPEILDDWPMHATKNVKTRAMIGACWHAQSQMATQFFKGSLFGMTFVEGVTESVQVFQCAQQCSEQLKFFGLDRFQPGERVLFSRDMTELTLTAIGVSEYNDLLRRVAYVNTKEKPIAGDRFVTITTRVKCKGSNKMHTLRPTNIELLVRGVGNRPLLMLRGKSKLSHTETEVERGVSIFPNLKMHLKESNHDDISSAMLNWCRITARPPLDQEREDFSSPANLIVSLRLDFEHLKDGLFLKGTGRMSDYENVLRQIHYFSSRPGEYSFRKFFLKCSLDDDQTISDDFVVTVSIEKGRRRKTQGSLLDDQHKAYPSWPHHPDPEPPVRALSQSNLAQKMTRQKMKWDSPQPNMEPSALSLSRMAGYDGYMYRKGNSPVGVSAVTIVAILACCVVVVIMLAAFFKFRTSRFRGRKRVSGEDGDLAWDDSGMNITVNPLEQINKSKNDGDEPDIFDDGGNDNEASEQEEDDISDDDDMVLPHVKNTNRGHQLSGLEWDDSTLHDSLVNHNCKHTYRV